MARNSRTSEEFDAIAAELESAAATLRKISETLRTNKMPGVLIHGSTTFNKNLPAVLQWVDKANADTTTQLRAHIQGVPSAAAVLKEINIKNKLAAARKKPAKKKA